jgi:SAM-dependent methyltransferase
VRIIGISLIKNEEDIIEAFIRHNLSYLDALIVLDNSSCDRTRSILTQLMKEGLPLCVLDDPDMKYIQSEKTTNLLQSVVPIFRPGWVIPIDADECLMLNSHHPFSEMLGQVPTNHFVKIPWKSYIPTPTDDPFELNPLRRIRRRKKVEDPQWYKVAIPSPMILDESLTIGQGNHAIHSSVSSESYREYMHPSLGLAHFPVRTSEQIIGKALVGWLAYLCMPKVEQGMGVQWQSLYQRFLLDESISPEELTKFALTYACENPSMDLVDEPLRCPREYALIYPGVPSSRLYKVTKMAEGIAKQMANLSKPAAINAPAGAGLRKANASGDDWKNIHKVRMDCDIPPFRYIFEKFSPVSVLDIGCGMGTYIRRFKEWGVEDVLGIERDDMGPEFLVPGGLRLHNLESMLNLDREFDLVICTEVIEHLAPEFEDRLLDTIVRHASRLIVFSAAQPRQPGFGHVNLKPVPYWAERLRNRGWEILPFPSLSFRLAANFSWFKRNSLVLARSGSREVLREQSLFSPRDVLQNQDPAHIWIDQKPGLYEYTLLGKRLKDSVIQGSGNPPEGFPHSSSIPAPDEIPLRWLVRRYLPVAVKNAFWRRLRKLKDSS